MTNHYPDASAPVAVLVVDDARFTCEMIRRTLRANGFHDVRVATTAREALERLAERRADIVLADWLMPEIDGLALTRRIREQDERDNRYTYILLLTARDGLHALTEAFEQGVDDFIGKSPDHQELIARIHAAARIASLQNELIRANRHLLDLNRQLRERGGIDVASGLGNSAYIVDRLGALIRHVEGRSGIGLCGLVRVNDLAGQREHHGDEAMDEVVATVASRLQHTVRPLDIIGRVSTDTFALIMLHHGAEPPHPNAFRRIFHALNLRAYKTSAGFLNVAAAMAVTSFAPPWADTPRPEAILDATAAQLDAAQAAGQVLIRAFREPG